jgi:hypothetical protein
MVAVANRREAWVGLRSGHEDGLRALGLGLARESFNESEMARSSERTDSYARQLPKVTRSRGWRFRGASIDPECGDRGDFIQNGHPGRQGVLESPSALTTARRRASESASAAIAPIAPTSGFILIDHARVETANIVSPSQVVKTGLMVLASPAEAICAILFISVFVNGAFVATTAIVECDAEMVEPLCIPPAQLV